MPSHSMQKGTLITREAYQALLEVKALIESAVQQAHKAGFETAGLAISRNPCGNPLHTLKTAAQTLQSPGFDKALSEAKEKVQHAVAWHEGQCRASAASA